MDVKTEAEPTRLARELKLIDATAIVVGSMIGSGIYITSAESARMIGSPGWLLVAWAVAGLLTVLVAFLFAELSAMMPRAGGQYVFFREAYGPLVGFLFGWATFLVVQTGTIAAVAVAFSRFVGVFVPAIAEDRYLLGPLILGKSGYACSLSTAQLVAIVTILGLTATNTRGLKTGAAIQTGLTIIKTASLVGLIVLGLTLGVNRQSAAFTSSWWNPSANGWSLAKVEPKLGLAGGLAFALLLGKAMIGPLFSQTAWNNVTFTGGETKDPGRTLPRALVLGCSTVVLLYLLANVSYLFTLPFSAIQTAEKDRVGVAAMEAMLGTPGLYAMAAAILVSTFGCANGIILAGSRVYYAMAKDGLFFSRLGTLNSRHVPAAALVAQGIWAALLTLPRTVTWPKDGGEPQLGNAYSQLLEYVVSADLTFYTLMSLAVIALRFRAPQAERPYRTPLYPLLPLLYGGLAIALLVDLAYLNPKTSGAGFLLVLTGLPIYALRRIGKPSAPSSLPGSPGS